MRGKDRSEFFKKILEIWDLDSIRLHMWTKVWEENIHEERDHAESVLHSILQVFETLPWETTSLDNYTDITGRCRYEEKSRSVSFSIQSSIFDHKFGSLQLSYLNV